MDLIEQAGKVIAYGHKRRLATGFLNGRFPIGLELGYTPNYPYIDSAFFVRVVREPWPGQMLVTKANLDSEMATNIFESLVKKHGLTE